MAKVLSNKENKQLYETIERYTDGLIFAMKIEVIIPILSAAKTPKKAVDYLETHKIDVKFS